MKKIIGILLLAVGLAVVSNVGVRADQSDQRLDGLFEALLEAENIGIARPIEISIWQIWTAVDDGAIQDLMTESAEAMSRQDYKRALSYLDQVVEIAPGYAEGWNRRATVYYLADFYEESLDDIAQTLALEPRHFGALSGRGLVLTAMERMDEALGVIGPGGFEGALALGQHCRSAAMVDIVRGEHGDAAVTMLEVVPGKE